MSARTVEELLRRHIVESRAGIVDKHVSELSRGEATARDYYILKVDVEGSTRFLWQKQGILYPRLAHCFLSTVDRITRDFGADPEQTEYHGDSVLAFFPAYGRSADDVLKAATFAHFAVKRLREIDEDFKAANLKTRTLLHFGTLNVINVGPFGESHRIGIGKPIHVVALREKQVVGGVIWASDEFAQQLSPQFRRTYLRRQHKVEIVAKQVLVTTPQTPAASATLGSLFGQGLGALGQTNHQRLAELLYPKSTPPVPKLEWQDIPENKPDGYTVDTVQAYRDLGIPLIGSAIT